MSESSLPTNATYSPLAAEVMAQLRAVQEREIAIAVANYECNEPIRKVYEAVRAEYEQEFIDEYRLA